MIATAVGNYPKIPNSPGEPKLRRAIAKFEREEISEENLKRIEDEVTKDVLAEQVRAGLDLLTDGQIRWEDGQIYFARKIGGFSIDGLIRYFDTNTYYRQPVVEGKVEWKEPIGFRDYGFAQGLAEKPVKPVITGPYTLARLSQNSFYPSFEELVMDLASALNREALSLQGADPPWIQFDEPAILKHKEDFPLFERAMNVLTSNLKVKTSLYTWFGDLEGLYPQLFRLPFDLFGLDLVRGRGSFELIEEIPEGKGLGLGIVDARNTKLESGRELVEIIKRVSQIVPPGRLHINPSCGLEYLPREIAYQKLALVAQAASQAEEVIR